MMNLPMVVPTLMLIITIFSPLVCQTTESRPATSDGDASRYQLNLPFPATTHPAADIMPAVSPNGKWLAFVSSRNKNYDIWIKPAGGGLAKSLTVHSGDDYSPSWSADGKRIVFVSRRDDAEGDIYEVSVAQHEQHISAGKVKRLTSNKIRETDPVYSPDGRWIAYSAGVQGDEQICLYDTRSRTTRQLTESGGSRPDWSPDGKWLAYDAPSALFGNARQVYLLPVGAGAESTEPRLLTLTDQHLDPHWSAGGDGLVVQCVDQSGQSFLSVVRWDSLEERQGVSIRILRLTESGQTPLSPFWAPDGQIYYCTDAYGNLDIWRLAASGLIPIPSTPENALNLADQVRQDYQIGSGVPEMAYAAIGFYFPDSISQVALAGLHLGRLYHVAGDFQRARQIFQRNSNKYVSEYGGIASQVELASLDNNADKLVEIRTAYPQMPAIQAACELQLARMSMSAGDHQTALRLFRSISRRYGSLPEITHTALQSTADLYRRLKLNSEAEEVYLEIIAGFPEQTGWRETAINNLITMPLEDARPEEQMVRYQLLIQSHRARPSIVYTVHFQQAVELELSGKFRLAENEYINLIEQLAFPEDQLLTNLRARVMARRVMISVTLDDLPAATQQFALLEGAYARSIHSGEVERARSVLTDALIARGRLLLRSRDVEYAASMFHQARQVDPGHIEAHRGYLAAKAAQEQIDEAIEEYRLLQSADPNDAVILYSLGLAFSYMGDRDAATLRYSSALIEQALAMNYRLIPAYLTLAFNYEGIEKLEEQERQREKGFFERIAFVLPGILDNAFRAITFRPPAQPERWYERAIDALTVAIALNDEKSDPSNEAQLALNLANNYYNLGEFGFENAYEYFRVKLKYDSTFVSAQQKAIIYERIGRSGMFAEDYSDAAQFLAEASRLSRSLKDVAGEIRNLERLGLLYQQSGDFESAISAFRSALKVRRRENIHEHLSLDWRNIAFSYNQLAREGLLTESEEAVSNSLRAIELINSEGKTGFPEAKKNLWQFKMLGIPLLWGSIGKIGESNVEGFSFDEERELVYSIMGDSHRILKDYDEAVTVLKQKAASFRQRNNPHGEAVALNNLGILYYSLRDYENAATYFSQSFRLCEQQAKKNRADQGFLYGKVTNLINLCNLALLSEQEWGISLSESVSPVLEISSADVNRIAILSPRKKLAIMNMLACLKYYGVAAQLETGAPQIASVGGTPSLDMVVRTSMRALAQLPAAAALYDSALAVAQSERLYREETIIRKNIASLYQLSGDMNAAMKQLLAAHEIALAQGLSDLTWRVEHELARMGASGARSVGSSPQLQEIDWYKTAMDIMESIPVETESVEQRIGERRQQQQLYEDAILQAIENRQEEAALLITERSRAKQFINILNTRYISPKKQWHRYYWGWGGGWATNWQKEISDLSSQLRQLSAEDPQRPLEIARVRNQLTTAEHEYELVIAEAVAEDPELASFFSVQPFDLLELRKTIDSQTGVLVYFSTQDKLLAWLVRRDDVQLYRLPVTRNTLREQVKMLRDQLLARGEGGAAAEGTLGKVLLDPIAGLDDISRLIIVPDDALNYLPFVAMKFRGELLADLMTISRTSSLQALRYAGARRSLKTEPVLIIDSESGTPGKAFAGRADGEVLVLADRDWFAEKTRPRLESAGILHLRPRFFSLPRRPMESCFILEERSRNFMPLHRMFELDLGASLICLEKSSFPFEPGQRGDEMIALQRSLIYAGTSSVLLSQWELPDKIRERFFELFYEYMPDMPLDEALGAARHQMREEHADPFYWAGFELFGYPGMNNSEKADFAELNFERAVSKGTRFLQGGDYSEAQKYYQDALIMARQLGRSEVVGLLYDRIKVSAISNANYTAACEIESQILQQAIESDDITQQLQSYRNLSIWNRLREDFQSSRSAEAQLFEIANDMGMTAEKAGSLLQSALTEEAAGNYADAIVLADEAAELLLTNGQSVELLNARILQGRFAIQADRNNEAIEILEDALISYPQADDAQESREPTRVLGIAHQLLGTAYSRLSGHQRALNEHRQASSYFESIADTANLGRASQFLAETYWLRGNYQDALREQRKAISISKTLGDRELEIRQQNTLGLILMTLGQLDDALETGKRALEAAINLEESQRLPGRRAQAIIHTNIGLTYIQQREYRQALGSFRTALALDREQSARRGMLYASVNIGQLYQSIGMPDSAAKYLDAALLLADSLGDQRARAKALYGKGMVARLTSPAEARSRFEEALVAAEQIFLDELIWRCWREIGKLDNATGKSIAALEAYKASIAALERISNEIKVEEFRSGFIDDKSGVYTEAINLLIAMNLPADALIVAERAKSRSFADMLGNRALNWGGSADSLLLSRKAGLEDEIQFLQGKLVALRTGGNTVRDNQGIDGLSSDLSRKKSEYSDLLAEIKSTNPELADAVSIEPVAVERLQAMLNTAVDTGEGETGGEVLVEYYYSETALIIWAVDAGTVRAVSVAVTPERLNDAVVQFRQAIENRSTTERLAKELYQWLITPIAPYLTEAAQLIIVPHGSLHYLPFAALQDEAGAYLIDRFALGGAPSATVFSFCSDKARQLAISSRQGAAGTGLNVLAFGNPATGNSALDLPFAGKEIASMRRTFGAITSFMREEATPAALFANAAKADLLHFSCHGAYDVDNPLFSELLLAPDSSGSGSLAAYQVFGLDLKASLVVLSACETGLARISGGDEVIGLARGFIFAGAPSLVTSLWTVDDLATAITIKRFYRYLNEGMSVSAALGKAQRFIRDQHNSHPAYWAALGVVGAASQQLIR